MYIYAFVNYIFSDNYVLTFRVEAFISDKDIRLNAHKHYSEYQEHIKLNFPTTSPEFEFLNCVT